jgi:hypothetical protein
MTRQNLLYILLSLVCFVAVLHTMASLFSLYWRVAWFDILPHFFGGAFVALGLFWLSFFSGYSGVRRLSNPISVFALIFFGTLIVGIGWEVFEYLLGHIWSPEGYWLDTMTDLSIDVLGALTAYLFIRARS